MDTAIPLLKFTPSAQDPQILEVITVQREPLVTALVESALDVRGGLRHRLLIGPRGIGKTHLLSLTANRLRVADPEATSLVLAWLHEDPWGIRGYDKLLAQIAAAIADETDDEELAAEAAALRAAGDREAALRGEELVRRAAGARRVVLLAENLDEIFQRIGAEGQTRLRALAEDWGQLLVIATAPQLFAGVQRHASPFYGFFAVTHVDELSLDNATELLKRVARLRRQDDLLRFLDSEVGAQRLAAVEALAGGHPRIWLLLAGCISIEAIDELVPLFLEALDDLTPYYQDRLRELSPQQQEVVILLSEAGGALSNRELTDRSGIPQNQIATMLRHLTERGYVRRAELPERLASGDRRKSWWELREPLMRLCLDVKQARGEPLRIVVQFLRAWYGPRLLDELDRLPSSAQLARQYASEAFRTLTEPLPADDLLKGTPAQILARAELGLDLQPDNENLRVAKVSALLLQGRLEEARGLLEELVREEPGGVSGVARRTQLAVVNAELGETVDASALIADARRLQEELPDSPEVAGLLAFTLELAGRDEETLEAFARAMQLDPEEQLMVCGYGETLSRMGRHEEALGAYERALALDPAYLLAVTSRAAVLVELRRFEEAVDAYARAAELAPADAAIADRRGLVLGRLKRLEEAAMAFGQAVELAPERATYHHHLGFTLVALGQIDQGIAALERATELDPGQSVVHRHLASALHGAGRLRESIDVSLRAVELDPDDARTRDHAGLRLAEATRVDEAIAMFTRAVELEPSNGEYHLHLGLVYGAIGRVDEAIVLSERAVELEPSNARIQQSRGRLLTRLGRYELAQEALRAAVELQPDEPEHRRYLAEALRESGRLAEAREIAAEAVALGDVLARFTLGEIALTGGDLEQLLRQLDEALAVWARAGETPPGDTALLCALVLKHAPRGPRRRELIERLVTLYRDAGALGELTRGLVDAVPRFVADDVSQHDADAWVEDWSKALPSGPDVAVRMLRAAGAWKRDRDQARLLALPAEERAILVEVLELDA